MREQMSSFDIARMVLEIDALAGARAKKMYQPHYEQLVIRFNPKEAPTQDLVIVRGKRAYFSRRDRPMPMQPASFAMLLRKYLSNGRLLHARQHGFDRIMVLEFDTKDGRRDLVIEMFRDGNVILLDEEGVIIQPLTHVKYESRTIKRGFTYDFPPEPMDPRRMDVAAFHEVLSTSNRNLANTLGGRVNLGRVYANALCAAANLSPDLAPTEIDVDAATALFNALTSLLSAIESDSPAIAMLANDEAARAIADEWEKTTDQIQRDSLMAEHCEEVGPSGLPEHMDRPTIIFPTLSEAIDGWKGAHDAGALARREAELIAESTAPGQADSEAEKLARREVQQESAIGKLQTKGSAAQDIAKSIQDNYEHIDSLLNQVNESVSAEGWSATRKQIKKIEWIESGDPSERTILAFLPDDEDKPGQKVTLFLDLSVHQNAQRYFSKGRKDKHRAGGAAAALRETQRKQKKIDKQRAKDEAAGRVIVSKRSKRFWFERNRWTMLPAGRLLVGGRDAKGNDSIVRKHLSRDDLYFHADLHGAPSCSLKLSEGFEPDPNPNPLLPEGVPSFRLTQSLESESFDDETLNFAAQMAVCWSRAWGSGGGGATAFHAKPGQVSKTAETGESLGRGAFIVRGTRQWYRDLPLELCLGIVAINGIPLPLVGPHAVVSQICSRWIRISPGTQKKEVVATRIAKASGLVQDDVLSALPAGNLDTSDDHGILS